MSIIQFGVGPLTAFTNRPKKGMTKVTNLAFGPFNHDPSIFGAYL
ncbi:hypothetical protein HSIEG1_1671 [Enterococcus sp. HSIEG1]|nr:hypothetical protein HSIEG1_1671 [Enterococcus sp. HSIEG1]